MKGYIVIDICADEDFWFDSYEEMLAVYNKESLEWNSENECFFVFDAYDGIHNIILEENEENEENQ